MQNRRKSILCSIMAALIISSYASFPVLAASAMPTCDKPQLLSTKKEQSELQEKPKKVTVHIIFSLDKLIAQCKAEVKKSIPKKITLLKKAAIHQIKYISRSPFQLTSKELQIVRQTVANESADEPYKGQLAVAQCIYDACVDTDERPDHVLIPGQYASDGKTPVPESVVKAVDEIFNQGTNHIKDDLRWFYAPKYCSSEWHEKQLFITQIGGHKFFAPHTQNKNKI